MSKGIIRDQTYTFDGTNYRAGRPIPEEVARKHGLIESEEEGADGNSGETEIDATDAAKDLAEKHEIDLSEVDGSGDDGRILKGDVEALIDPHEE